MVASLLNFTVTRAIPQDVVTGLMTGQFKLYGGVIRGAPGTQYAGQIIRHLLPVTEQAIDTPILAPTARALGTVNTYQLHRLSGQVNELTATTQQVLQIATGTMVLSGLNLAVTAVGFAALNDKLKSLEGKLNEVQQEVKALRILMEMDERAKLEAALRDLLNVTTIKNPDHRHAMLFNSKNILAPINLKYKELLAGADILETAMAYEEYFCITSLAHTRCLAELGMLEIANRDLEEASEFWKKQAQRIANEFLLNNSPERFLFSDFAQDVPVSALVEWLDFAYQEERGYGWIDELRGQTRSWYAQDDNAGIAKRASSFAGKILHREQRAVKLTEIEQDRERVIPSFQKLVARSNVFEGYKAQYELLEANNVTPSKFESEMALLAQTAAVDGFLILQPTESVI
ncbi:MAG: hypothetical protein KC413_05425 [Anaerolineales bacterium]|nr:hypothetical protein [Anaerolineales bacterium]